MELFDKMRINLEKEEEDEDIKLSFKYKLCKGLVNETNQSLNAYNDYLELVELAKERKNKGEYDYNNIVEVTLRYNREIPISFVKSLTVHLLSMG